MKLIALFLGLISFSAFSNITVTTFNIRNFDRDLDQATDLEELLKILKDSSADVFAFEEIVNASKLQDFTKENFPNHSLRVSSCGGAGRQKLALLYNNKKFDFIEEIEDLTFSSGRSTSCGKLRPVFFIKLKHRSTLEDYVFGVVHLKAGGSLEAKKQRWAQYLKLNQRAINFNQKNLILLGDFNTTGYLSRDDDFVEFESFLNKSQMTTLSDQINCSSYWDGGLNSGMFFASLLDHVVVSENLRPQVEQVEVGAHCFSRKCQNSTGLELGQSFKNVSDHCPIRVSIKN